MGVGVVVRDPSRPGEVLVGKRKGSHGASAYALPGKLWHMASRVCSYEPLHLPQPRIAALSGGHLEGGEDWATTAMRELEEETGMHAPSVGLRSVMQTGRLWVYAGLKVSVEDFHFIHVTNDVMPEDGSCGATPTMCSACPFPNGAITSRLPLYHTFHGNNSEQC